MRNNRKTIKELTFKDNFMFAAAMLDAENCRMVIERVLGKPIERVEVITKKSMVYHPEYRGVRLDVYARDEANTHYDVEMQIAARKIFRRARYYHDQMDMELIGRGIDYEELPDSYVIFICDFDPFGLGKYRYTLRQTLVEDAEYPYEDGVHTVILSTKGGNDSETPEELIKFLRFAGASLEECSRDFGDPLVERLQKSIREIKQSREMGDRYMLFAELLKDEYNAGKAEGKAERSIENILLLLGSRGEIPDGLRRRIMSVTDEDSLQKMLLMAAQAESIESFAGKLREMLPETCQIG